MSVLNEGSCSGILGIPALDWVVRRAGRFVKRRQVCGKGLWKVMEGSRRTRAAVKIYLQRYRK